MATDIAFSLAIISMLGKRVPASVKIFTALAIVDDLGSNCCDCDFYTEKLEFTYLALSGAIFTPFNSFDFFKVKNIFSTSFQDYFMAFYASQWHSCYYCRGFIGIYHSYK